MPETISPMNETTSSRQDPIGAVPEAAKQSAVQSVMNSASAASAPTSAASASMQAPSGTSGAAVRQRSAWAVRFRNELRTYFNLADDLEPQEEAEASIRAGVSFRGSQLLVLIFAIFIASLGLNTDNVAVIIGAMLTSPLMGPIIGMGLAIGISDFELLRRSLKNILMAILGSLAASALYFLISPQYEGVNQLLARTSPSIYDVFIALFGGAAGIVSIACRNKGQVMPGVAIATSLMPPLCTAGYGLATWQMHFFFGALYLFITNMVFILFASWIGVKVLGYKKVVYQDTKRAHRVSTVVFSIVCATVAVSAYLTFQMIRTNIFLAKASNFVQTEMIFPNTQVLSHNEYVKGRRHYIDVTLIGAALPKDSLQLAMLTKLDSVGLGGTVLNIKQGFSIGAEGRDDTDPSQMFTVLQEEVLRRQQEIDSLRNVIASRTDFTSEGAAVMPELKVLFPEVRDMAVSRMVIPAEKGGADTLRVAFVKAPAGLPAASRAKLIKYLEVRLRSSKMHLSVNPSDFPWPSAD